MEQHMTGIDTRQMSMAPAFDAPLRQRLTAVRNFHTGPAIVRDAAGPVAKIELGPRWLVQPFVIVTSPQGAHDVLANSDGSFEKAGAIVDQYRGAWGLDLFSKARKEWLPRRKALQPLFTKKNVATFAGHMSAEADLLARNWSAGAEVDLDRECRRLTLQVLGRSVLGVDLGPAADALAPAMTTVLKWITNRATRPVRAPAWLPTPARRRMRRSRALIHHGISDAIARFRSDPTHDAPLIRAMLGVTDSETGKPLSENVIRDELAVFVGAGYDTTATTLAYTLWTLGRHPDIQNKVAAEVQALGDRPLTMNDVASLPYTVQVLHEALRLCPPGAAVARESLRDTVVDGLQIEAGALAIVAIYALHRDPALWDEPETFDPGRFERDRMKTIDRWQYLPFGGGPRSCIGDHFAMLEATLGLATIIRSIEITSTESDFPLALPFTMTAGGPIPAIVRART